MVNTLSLFSSPTMHSFLNPHFCFHSISVHMDGVHMQASGLLCQKQQRRPSDSCFSTNWPVTWYFLVFMCFNTSFILPHKIIFTSVYWVKESKRATSGDLKKKKKKIKTQKNVHPKHKDTGGQQWRSWQRFSVLHLFRLVKNRINTSEQPDRTGESAVWQVSPDWRRIYWNFCLIIVSILLLALRMTADQCFLQAAGLRSKPPLTLTVFVNTAALSSAVGQRAARSPGSTGIKPVKPLNYFQIQLENSYPKHRSTWNTPAGTEEDVQTWTAVPQLAGGQGH